MEEYMKIDEIEYSSGIRSLENVLDISNADMLGAIEGLHVYAMDLGNGTCFFLYDMKESKYLSYIAVDKNMSDGHSHLRQLENISGVKGSVSVLLFFLTRKRDMKFILTMNEPLTSQGLEWIVKTINSGRNLFHITDIEGKPIDIISLKNEWENSRIDTEYKGKISILIESTTGNSYDKLFEEQHGLLLCNYYILKDKDLI